MSHMRLVKALAAADTFIFNLWSAHKDDMLGHGVRMDEFGNPYVVVYSKKQIMGILPNMENGIPIRNEVVNDLNGAASGAPPAPKKNVKYLRALMCRGCRCGFEFAVIDLVGGPRDVAFCPVCAEGISPIKSISLALTERESQFELSKSMKSSG